MKKDARSDQRGLFKRQLAQVPVNERRVLDHEEEEGEEEEEY